MKKMTNELPPEVQDAVKGLQGYMNRQAIFSVGKEQIANIVTILNYLLEERENGEKNKEV